MKHFSDKPLKIPVMLHVHGDYTALDKYAQSLGYEHHGNNRDFCGWIATMGDSLHNPKSMIEEANDKLRRAQKQFKKAVIGLCQTGNFSVGYTIYTKN